VGHQLHVDDPASQRTFLEQVGVHGAGGGEAGPVLGRLRLQESPVLLDTIPRQVWRSVGDVLHSRGVTHHGMPRATAVPVGGDGPSAVGPGDRAAMSEVAALLGSADLETVATNDVSWDAVAAVEPLGEQDVYDATVLGGHNFVADGVCVHNSLEQDADMVVLLHREDAYEKESPRAGEADLIVAKHRNGPTATITVAFQGHYSRFVDMAQG